MDGKWIGFIIWCFVGMMLIGVGIFSLCSRKPVGFWANANVGEVTIISFVWNCVYCSGHTAISRSEFGMGSVIGS